MGVIGRPHGVRGLVRVHSYAEGDLAEYGPLVDDSGRSWTLAWRGEGVAELRDAEGRPVADRSAAEKLVNMRLFIDRDRLPAPGAEEFYLADLIGLSALDRGGAVLGRVAVVHDYGAGASIEIERDGAPALIVPFTRACVPELDIAAGRMVVQPPEETEAAPPGDAGEVAA